MSDLSQQLLFMEAFIKLAKVQGMGDIAMPGPVAFRDKPDVSVSHYAGRISYHMNLSVKVPDEKVQSDNKIRG